MLRTHILALLSLTLVLGSQSSAQETAPENSQVPANGDAPSQAQPESEPESKPVATKASKAKKAHAPAKEEAPAAVATEDAKQPGKVKEAPKPEPKAQEKAPMPSKPQTEDKKNQEKNAEDKKSEAKKPMPKEPEMPKESATNSDESDGPESKPAKDVDFELMGEFVGPVQTGEQNEYKTIGVQIRHVGDGSFEALQYAGGLPGQKTFSGESLPLVGRRNDDFIVLSGGPYAIFVESGSCLVVDRRGNRIGTLERVIRESPTMGAQAPEGAMVLFDGSGTGQFTTARVTPEGLLQEGADLLPMFQDFDLHVEFRTPYMPKMFDQKRGNSGCYLQSRYEVQILDSFALPPVFNGCSAIYRTKAPDLNMCLPPLSWQTYDIHFTAPRWGANGKKLRNAHITVWHNGVKTHDNYELKNKTGAGKIEEPTLLPIRFQNHSDPVRFRNIWIVDRGLVHAEFPVWTKK